MRPEPVAVPLAAVVPPGATVPADVQVTGITLDSRSVRPGDVYAALPGHRTHGARFAADAVAGGAVAILTDPTGLDACSDLGVPVIVQANPRAALGAMAARVYGDPAASLHLVGITGTNGKTTVASMVEAGLRAAGRTTGMIGTVGVQVAGVPHAGARTTPEAPDLQAMFAVMREAHVDSVVMEVSSIAIEEGRVGGVCFDVAAFTNLTQDHLDYHGTMEAYYRAKARLFTSAHARHAIIGVDDQWGRRLAVESAVPTQTWSLIDPSADWYAERVGDEWVVIDPEGGRTTVRVPIPGAFNVANALCAFAVLRSAGVTAEAAAAGIGGVQVPGRMQPAGRAGDVLGYVDYAHSPDAVERVLHAARESSAGRVIAVLGAGGDRDRGKRAEMGRTAARLADVVCITDDNPRSEDPAAIRAALREGAMLVPAAERAVIHEDGDRSTAISVAVRLAEAGDVILVLGKGHEQGQEVNGVVTPFDDVSVLAAALNARGAREGAT